ncbi:MAG: hypothetical protein O3C60_05100 [Planctomycetota bacterium]|nr:hypothetical protein [Planctomycetota bacterium]
MSQVDPQHGGHGEGFLIEPHNPFATRFLSPGQIPFFFEPGESIPSLYEAWLAAKCSGQIVGPHGTGKSTLLMEWAGFFASQAIPVRHVTITAANPPPTYRQMLEWRTADRGTVLMIDGYEQLSAVRRWRIERSARAHGFGLLVTTHRDLNLPWTYRTDCNLASMQSIARWLQRQCKPLVGEKDVADSYAKCGGSSRELLLSLFDIYHNRFMHDRTGCGNNRSNSPAANDP